MEIINKVTQFFQKRVGKSKKVSNEESIIKNLKTRTEAYLASKSEEIGGLVHSEAPCLLQRNSNTIKILNSRKHFIVFSLRSVSVYRLSTGEVVARKTLPEIFSPAFEIIEGVCDKTDQFDFDGFLAADTQEKSQKQSKTTENATEDIQVS